MRNNEGLGCGVVGTPPPTVGGAVRILPAEPKGGMMWFEAILILILALVLIGFGFIIGFFWSGKIVDLRITNKNIRTNRKKSKRKR